MTKTELEQHEAIVEAKKQPDFQRWLVSESLVHGTDEEITERLRQDCAGLLASEQTKIVT